YYPELGYYTGPRNKIGRSGDFFTSSNLTHAFGVMIGKQIEEMWRLMGEEEFTIVEFGAGTGALCYDILNYLRGNGKMYGQVHYAIIEKSPAMRQIEKGHLNEKVSWHESIIEIAPITGCILSNELLDNLSVHRVLMEEELMEVFVDYHNGFVEILRPASDELKNYFAGQDITLPKGFHAEINLEAVHWIETLAASLKKGYVLTIDYGYRAGDLYKQHKSQGTLLCYHEHQINDNPYINIGSQDITAHVNFTALCHWGLKNGLGCCGLTNQANFLLALGIKDYLRQTAPKEGNIAELAMKEAMLTRTLLVEMGSKFKVLIQNKGMYGHELSGLKLY
ncbi:MAG: SAM-dependent methyltransferase, partial [Bacteroidota bacterium]|nr:SAM-dependent methyltransferase [Bacteroidota bacterium]